MRFLIEWKFLIDYRLCGSSINSTYVCLVGRSESVRMKDDEVQLCRSASQLRAQFDKPNQHMTTATAQDNTPDGTESSEDPKAQEVMCVSGGLASVKSMFEGGNRNAQQPSGRQVAQDESLQAAMARSSISSKTIFQSGGAEPSNDDSDTTANKSQVRFIVAEALCG